MSTVRPANVNFRLYPHATFSEVTRVLDADQQPIDLSGRTARMQVRREQGTQPIYTLTTENGGIICNADGEIALRIEADATAPALNPPLCPDGEVWQYDLLITAPIPAPATTERLIQGVIVVLPGVTKPEPTP